MLHAADMWPNNCSTQIISVKQQPMAFAISASLLNLARGSKRVIRLGVAGGTPLFFDGRGFKQPPSNTQGVPPTIDRHINVKTALGRVASRGRRIAGIEELADPADQRRGK
jgi:hypothetical protein